MYKHTPMHTRSHAKYTVCVQAHTHTHSRIYTYTQHTNVKYTACTHAYTRSHTYAHTLIRIKHTCTHTRTYTHMCAKTLASQEKMRRGGGGRRKGEERRGEADVKSHPLKPQRLILSSTQSGVCVCVRCVCVHALVCVCAFVCVSVFLLSRYTISIDMKHGFPTFEIDMKPSIWGCR